jgi:AcrR family transcriptional regulator
MNEITVRRRLTPAAREREIVEAAADFFAEVGLDGQTRELAARLGVTQPLIYRYFPSKQALIDRVYEEVYLNRWDAARERALHDRSLPLRDRLFDFYHHYVTELLTERWLRIYLYAALEHGCLNRRHVELLEQRLIRPICVELAAAAGDLRAVGGTSMQPDPVEIEAVRQWHSGIVFYGVRKYLYRTAFAEDANIVIAAAVDALLGGVGAVLPGPLTRRRSTAP